MTPMRDELMAATDDAVQELETMLDEGIHLELDNLTSNDYVLHVAVDQGCEDCLVPDDVMRQILRDALDRRGVDVEEVTVVHR